MSDLNERLRESDPLRREPGLPFDDVERIRRALIAAAHSAPVARIRWSRPFGIMALAVLTLVIGAIATRRLPPERSIARSGTPAASEQRTQVHFSTPGGTRIVWTLDPGFQLIEARPRRQGPEIGPGDRARR
jgi:hypothetical protein